MFFYFPPVLRVWTDSALYWVNTNKNSKYLWWPKRHDFLCIFFPFNKLKQFFSVRTKTPTDINPIAYCGIAFTYSYRISKERESDTFNYWLGLSFDVVSCSNCCLNCVLCDRPLWKFPLSISARPTENANQYAIYRFHNRILSAYRNNEWNMWSLFVWYIAKMPLITTDTY